MLPLPAVSLDERRSQWSPRALATAGALALLAPLLFPLATGRIFTRDDLASLHLPFRYLYQQSLIAGEFLLWTPAYHAGYFLHGAGEAGMAHPLHLLLYRGLPLGAAFNLEIISSYLFLFTGMYLLWRALALSSAAAIVGAMLAAFSGFTVFNLMHVNHIATLAHAPWLLLACHGVLSGNRPARSFALAAMVTGSQVLTGNPQYMWMTLLAVLGLLAWMWPSDRSLRAIAALAVAALLGVMIGAVQLLPSMEFFNDSARAAMSREMALSFSLPPLNLVQLWTPFTFQYRAYAPGADQLPHEFVVYNGAFCTAALAWIAMRWSALPHRRLAAGLIVFAIVSLVLAFGRYGGVYPLLVNLPLLNGLRGSSRHIVLTQFAMSGLAAIAFEDIASVLRERAPINQRHWPLAIPVLLAIATVAIGWSLNGSAFAELHQMRFAALPRAALSTLPLIAVLALLHFAAQGRSWALPLLVAITVADLGFWGYAYAYRWGPLQSIEELASEAQVPPDARAGDVIPPVPGGRDYLAILRGLRLTAGYTGLYPRSTLDFSTPVVERLAGLTWRGDGDRWTRVDDTLPRARMIAQARASTSIAADLATIDVAQVALVADATALSGDAGQSIIRVDRPGHLEIDTTSNGRQLLVLTERFHGAWRATVDGSAVTPTAVDADFLGVAVDAGSHHVALKFLPDSFTRGLWITFAGLILTLITSMAIARGSWLARTM